MWLSATFGMVAEELLVIKLIFPTLTNNEVGKEDSLSWNLLQKKKETFNRVECQNLEINFFFYKVWMNENAKWSHLLSFTFCLKALTLGIGFSLWGDKNLFINSEIPGLLTDLLHLKIISPWCWWIYALLLGVDLSIPWIFTEVGKIFHLSECPWAVFSEAYRIIGFISVWIVRTPKDINEHLHLNESTLIFSCERGFVS